MKFKTESIPPKPTLDEPEEALPGLTEDSLEKTRDQEEELSRELEKLAREVKKTGWPKATENFFKAIGFDILAEKERLSQELEISKLRNELKKFKEKKETKRVAEKELEIVNKVQLRAINFFNKKQVIKSLEKRGGQLVNYLGSSFLTDQLLGQSGIDYLQAHLFNHSLALIVTKDQRVYWRDFSSPSGQKHNQEITDHLLEQGGVKDILDFIKKPQKQGLSLELKANCQTYIQPIIKDRPLTFLSPQLGLEINLVNNIAQTFNNLGQKQKALEAYKQLIELNPQFAPSYYELAEAYYQLGHYDQAIEAYQQAILLDAHFPGPYYGLGKIYYQRGQYHKAVQAYKQAVLHNPRFAYAYYGLGLTYPKIGQERKAIEAYQRFIKFWQGSHYWVEKAEEAIVQLKEYQPAA